MSQIIQASIAVGLGDIIYIKGLLDPEKHHFSQIDLSFYTELIKHFRSQANGYETFLTDIGNLLFTEEPFSFSLGHKYNFKQLYNLASDYQIKLQKPNLRKWLCKNYGDDLNFGSEYIVLTTKIRQLTRYNFDSIKDELFKIINELSKKYKIVILGERYVEQNEEYIHYTSEQVYCIYDELIKNIDNNRIIDLTVPALGITTPDLKNIQRDCYIMDKAKFVITLGIGGNFCMATACANVIGFREDQDEIGNIIYDTTSEEAFIVKDWSRFKNKLNECL